MPHILIVDDDMHLRKLVLTYGELDGYQCEEAENATLALEKIRSTRYDLVLLDVMMPGIDGFEMLAEIRKHSQMPVIMLTSRTEEYDKLFGFNLGADDYVSKPFSPKELMARIGAVLKRSGRKQADQLRFGELIIEPEARTVMIGEISLNLSPKEYELLLNLSQNDRIVMSREQLLTNIWGYDYYGDVRTVDTHIKSLRQHMGDYSDLIKTVWGVGYKFEYQGD